MEDLPSHFVLGLYDFLDLAQEPAVVAAHGVHFVDSEAAAKGLGDDQQPVRARLAQSGAHGIRVGPPAAPGISTSFKPVRPVSIDRKPFCRLSWKVRPMLIASPTDFIEVVSNGSAPGNFSKVKRGILVTT